MSGSFMARVGLAGFACGVILLYSLAVLPPLLWLITVMVIPLSMLMWAGAPVLRGLAIVIAGGLLGIIWAGLQADTRQRDTLPASLEGVVLEVSGYLCDVPSRGSFGSVRFGFCVEQWHLPPDLEAPGAQELPQKVRLAWYGEAATTSLPQQLRLKVVLKRPHGSVNPAGFRYESWLYRKGFGATGTIRALTADRSSVCRLGCRYHRWRNGLVNVTSERLAEARHFPLITSLMIGYRGHMEPGHWDVLKATGTIHLVAISGLHLGLVAAGAGFLCRRLLLCLPQRWASPHRLRGLVFFCVSLASLAYALAAGFSVPTRRALIMVVFAGWVVLGARKAGAMTGLLGAMVMVLLSDPFSPLDQGFWLSFGAVFVLVLLFSLRLRQAGWFRGLILAQVAVFAALWPILESLGQSQVVIGFVANLFAIPWVSLVVMPLVVAGALVMMVTPAVDGLVADVLDGVFGVLWRGLSWLAEVDVMIAAPGMPVLLLLALVVLLALLVPFRGFRAATISLGMLWMVTGVNTDSRSNTRNAPVDAPELWVWDVGQGLSVMVRHEDQVLVYDTGPALPGVYSAVDSELIPNLRELGVRRIDTLIISHGDGDHAGGLPLLLDTFNVRRLITGEPSRIKAMLPDNPELKVNTCASQGTRRMGGLELHFWRSPGKVEGNDASCVLTIRFGLPAVEVVLPGDITRRTERIFTEGQRSGAAQFRVVLAPHHGSKTSSSELWVKQLAPDIVVFSAGYRHRFGHPHPEVVSRYLSAGSRLLNTATSGAVRLVWHGKDMLVTEARAQTPFWIRKPESH